jgi:hypothetical protein
MRRPAYRVPMRGAEPFPSLDGGPPTVPAPAATPQGCLGSVLVLVALVAVVVGHLAWLADGLLRDEEAFAGMVGGIMRREPVRTDLAEELVTVLAEAGADAAAGAGDAPSEEQRRTLTAAAEAVAASSAFDAQVDAAAGWFAAGAISGTAPPGFSIEVAWSAYRDEVAARDAALAARLDRVPPPSSDGDGEPLFPEDAPFALGDVLAPAPVLRLSAFAIAFAAAVGATVLRRSRGRLLAGIVAAPAVLVVLVRVAAGGEGIAAFVVRTAAGVLLPAAAATALIGLAVLVTGTRVAPGPQRRDPQRDPQLDAWLGGPTR